MDFDNSLLWSFFSTIEVLRACNHSLFWFSNEHIKDITSRAHIKKSISLSSGCYKSDFISNDGSSLIFRFSYSGFRPHDYAWHQLDSVVGGCRTSSEILQFRRMLGIIDKTQWRQPNTVRNEWNYDNMRLYTRLGDDRASEMLKHLHSKESSIKWSKRHRLSATPENQLCAMIYLMNIVYDVLESIMSEYSGGGKLGSHLFV